ncbi:MAG: hypothetical protein NPIRA06_03780 [Nitrospirales bacterium]|nr:MAG: hypothetical protein NPIRA06_03780 [Nitrospirales bacterium]
MCKSKGSREKISDSLLSSNTTWSCPGDIYFQVILLLIFMVAGIYFIKDLLLFVFAKVLLEVRSKTNPGLLFEGMRALLDALTAAAVIIAVNVGFLKVSHRVHRTAFPAIYFRL